MGLATTNIQSLLLSYQKSDLQFEIMHLSNTLQTKQMVQSQELQGMTKRHENETNSLRAKFEVKDSVSSADLNNLQDEIDSTTAVVPDATGNPTKNPNVTNPILTAQQETKRSAESYMQEASEMNLLTSKQDTEKSNLIAKNNAAEKNIEQDIAGKEARLKSVTANEENINKQKDNDVKSFAMWGK